MCPRTKEQLKGIREEKLLLISDAALRLFANRGYEGTSISQIAKDAGISKGLVYNYFESKESILNHIVDHIFDEMWARFGLVGKSKMTKEDYENFLVMSLDLVLEDPDHWRLYFAVFTQPNVMKMIMGNLMIKAAPYMQMMHDYYLEQGYENPDVWMRYVSACLDGIQMHIMLDPENFPLEDVKKIVLKQLL